jgi:hypothetical protein
MDLRIEWYHLMFIAWFLILLNQMFLFKRLKGVEQLGLSILTGAITYDKETGVVTIEDEED